MTRVSPLFRFMPYGAPELIDAGRPNMARALVLASVGGALAFALLGVLRLAHPTIVVMPPVMPKIEILPDPDVEILHLREPSNPSTGRIPPSVGNAIDKIVPDLTAITQPQEFDPTAIGPPGAPTDVIGGPVVLDNRAPAETLPERGVYTYVEYLPEVIRKVEPEFPDLPKQLNLSGYVIVHILVGRNGRVVNAVIDEKVNDPMFNEAALAAARGFLFRAGSSNGHPVAAWVTQPFRFTSR